MGTFPVIKSEEIFPGNISGIFNKFPNNGNLNINLKILVGKSKLNYSQSKHCPSIIVAWCGLLMTLDFELKINKI